MKENLIVIFGGVSSEHDVSIISALQAINYVDADFYNVIPIYIAKNGLWYTGDKLKNIQFFKNINYKNLKIVSLIAGSEFLHKKTMFGFRKYKKINCAIPILHGINGEDGKVMSILELCNIPYTSANPTESGVCLDKSIFKTYVNGLEINTVNGISIFDFEFKCNPSKVTSKILSKLSLPVIVKPSSQGSSIGVKVCNNNKELEEALLLSFSLGNKTLIEEYLMDITEINVAVLKDGNKTLVSELEQPIKNKNILSFENKYLNDSNSMESISRIIPAPINKTQKDKIIDLAKIVYENLGLKGVVRFDFIICEDEIYLNEVNTIPGSLAFYLFKPIGIDYSTLINILIKNAYETNENLNSKCHDFPSSLLLRGNTGLKK